MVAYDRLVAAARTQTGLEDFGDDSFREGLEILVRSLRDEARLNAAGEAVIYPRLIGHLVNRLQIEDWYRRYPEIDDVPIVAPLFGLGLPRTGSTVLSFLLAQDPRVRFLRPVGILSTRSPALDGGGTRPSDGGSRRAGWCEGAHPLGCQWAD